MSRLHTSSGADSDGQWQDREKRPAISDASTVEALLQFADQTGKDELGAVIRSLQEQGENCVAVVRRAVQEGDCDAITAVTHGLTGSAGAMRASTLESISRGICECARQGDLQEASVLVEQLQGELVRAIQELTEHHRVWLEGYAAPQEPASE